MTTDESIRILNERKHNGHAEWEAESAVQPPRLVLGPDRYETLTVFEATAIAEKYQRESAPLDASKAY